MVGRHEEYLASEKPVPPDSKGFSGMGGGRKLRRQLPTHA